MTIELKHSYRQSDVRFIKLLNRVRDNRLDAAAIGKLNQHYAALGQGPNDFLKAVKHELGDNFSYGDIKLMAAHRKHLAAK